VLLKADGELDKHSCSIFMQNSFKEWNCILFKELLN